MNALFAGSPAPAHARELMLFGQFVGEWEFDSVAYRADGSVQRASGEWHFGWVLEGRAIQDVWIFPARGSRGEMPPGYDNAGEYGEYGTTIRFYDPHLSAWRVAWIGPVHANLRTFIARKVGDEIVMEATTGDEPSMRWTFSEITDRSFRWRSVVSDGDGQTWRKTEELFVRRREPAAERASEG